MADSEDDIFRLSFTGRPLGISIPVREFCRELSPNYQPIVVPIRPIPHAAPLNCFSNVRQQVGLSGGAILFGWTIWEWSRVFLEAEHHAVWSYDDKLIDVTPNDKKIDSIVFLPDPQRTYDFTTQKRLPNARVPLTTNPAVLEWLSLLDRLNRFSESRTTPAGLLLNDEEEDFLRNLSNAADASRTRVIVWLGGTTRRNDKCICGSGRKYKNCHMRFLSEFSSGKYG